jgi:hypothetical protein
MNDTSRRLNAVSPEVLPEHLRGIREQVLSKHIYVTEHSAPSDADYAEVVMIVARLKMEDEERDKLLDYLEGTHRAAKNHFEGYQSLIDGIVNWAGWAANRTRRLNGNETKAPAETPKVEA